MNGAPRAAGRKLRGLSLGCREGSGFDELGGEAKNRGGVPGVSKGGGRGGTDMAKEGKKTQVREGYIV